MIYKSEQLQLIVCEKSLHRLVHTYVCYVPPAVQRAAQPAALWAENDTSSESKLCMAFLESFFAGK